MYSQEKTIITSFQLLAICYNPVAEGNETRHIPEP
jgi:hypothetical protein